MTAHALYLVTGYLYFLPVIDAEPIRWRPTLLGRFLLLLATMPVDTLVGVVLSRNLICHVWPDDVVTSATCLPLGTSWP